MSEQEMNRVIAEHCPGLFWKDHESGWHFKNGALCKDRSISRDLNAIHEAEKTLKPEQWRIYSDKLMVLVRDSDLTLNGSNIEARYKTAHAPAPQRCEAFVRTIGKWKETP